MSNPNRRYIDTEFAIGHDISGLYAEYLMKGASGDSTSVDCWYSTDSHGNIFISVNGMTTDVQKELSWSAILPGKYCFNPKCKVYQMSVKKSLEHLDAQKSGAPYVTRSLMTIGSAGLFFEIDIWGGTSGFPNNDFYLWLIQDMTPEDKVPTCGQPDDYTMSKIPRSLTFSAPPPPTTEAEYGSSSAGRPGRQTVSYSSAGRNRPY